MHRIKQNTELKILLAIAILVLLAADAHAIGIARSFNSVTFVPNKEINLQYYLFNDERKDGMATIEIDGSLKNRTKVDPDKIKFSADQELVPFTVSVKMPGKPEGDLMIKVQSEPLEQGQITGKLIVIQRLELSEQTVIRPPPETAKKILEPTEIRQIILPVQSITFIKSLAGNIVLYIALFATIINVIIYLVIHRKRKIAVEDRTLDKTLVDYFKTGMDSGMPEQLLVDKLSNNGWSKDSIDKHLNYAKEGRHHQGKKEVSEQ